MTRMRLYECFMCVNIVCPSVCIYMYTFMCVCVYMYSFSLVHFICSIQKIFLFGKLCLYHLSCAYMWKRLYMLMVKAIRIWTSLMSCTLSVWYLILNYVGVRWSRVSRMIAYACGHSLRWRNDVNSGVLVCDSLVLFTVIVIYCTTSDIRDKLSIKIDDYGKFGEYQVRSGDVQWQELLSLTEKDEKSFDSARSL